MNNQGGFHYVNRLKLKIVSLLEPNDASLNSQSRENLKFILEHVGSFEELAKTTLDSDLDRAIFKEAFYFLSELHHLDSERINEGIQDILERRNHSFIAELKMKEQECSDGLYNISYLDREDDDDDQGVVSSEVIGVRDVYQQLKDMVMRSRSEAISLVGMPGIGKTTLANKLFNDPTIVERFDHRLWVRVGKKYRGKFIIRRLFEEIDQDNWESKKHLIVLDDVWDRFTIDLFHLYDWDDNRILITSRLEQQDDTHDPCSPMDTITMRLLDGEESWNLLREKVFSQGPCPPQLVKAGKEISKNCEGLPLTILAIARLLSASEEKSNPEYWTEVAEKTNHQIFLDAYDEISKVLLPSYTFLPPLLQMCFMFIGLFPPKYEAPRSKIFNLWLVDGFPELNVNISTKDRSDECLEELISNNLVMIYQRSSSNKTTKTCGLHSSLWHMSKKKARETKFALLLSTRNDGLGNGLEGHHRLSFNNNVLFAIKDVHKSVEDNCASAARSLFCFAPYHQYQVPLCFRLKLIRELDALSIRFYEFPVEVLQLARLTYLSLTSNGMIPSSISQLQFLEFLIVDRHQNIKLTNKDTSYLPVEIWSLQKLKHLQVMGSDLPDPRGASLSSLSTLLNVSARSCTKTILEGIPILEKLGIRIELTPDYDILDTHISYLCKLKSFKCAIVNAVVLPPVALFSSFPSGSNLRKLSLTGLGYPWKEMNVIASLPGLWELKLKNYAFQGLEWEVEETKFVRLIYLLIEDTDLVNWKFGHGAFRKLASLTLKQCYKLEKIHGKFRKNLTAIELVDCNPLFVEEVKKTLPIKEDNCIITVHSSWEDEKLKR